MGKEGLREVATQCLQKAALSARETARHQVGRVPVQRAGLQRVRRAHAVPRRDDPRRSRAREDPRRHPAGDVLPRTPSTTSSSPSPSCTRASSSTTTPQRSAPPSPGSADDRDHIEPEAEREVAQKSALEPLIFERSKTGRRGYQLPDARRARAAARRRCSRRRCAATRSPDEVEVSEVDVIRHFTRLSKLNFSIDAGPLSARLVHDEAQPAHQRGDRAHARLRAVASAAARASGAGQSRAAVAPRADAEGDLRHAARHAAAGGRRARRADRHPDGAQGARQERQRAQVHPHPRLRARHQPGLGRIRRLRDQGAEVEQPRHRRSVDARSGGDRRRAPR